MRLNSEAIDNGMSAVSTGKSSSAESVFNGFMTASGTNYRIGLELLAPAAAKSQRVGLSIRLLSVTIVFITAFALSRVRLGPIPLYFEDLLIAAVLAVACMRPGFFGVFLTPIGVLSAWLWGFIVLSESWGMAIHGSPFEPLYMIGRFSLSIAILAAVPALIRTQADLNHMLRGFVIGMLITAILTILTSVPLTRGITYDTVFAIPLLGATTGERKLEQLEETAAEHAGRGRSLFGSVNVTGGVLATVWPLSFFAYRRLKLHWKTMALAACVITPFGAMATYARSTWLAIAAILCLTFFAGYGKGRSHILLAVTLGVVLVVGLGASSNYFYIDRIVKKTEDAVYDRGVGENERLLSYVEPFMVLAKTPNFFIVGNGSAGRKLSQRGTHIDGMVVGNNDHSVFGMTFYNFGLGAAICQVGLMVGGYFFVLRRLMLTRGLPLESRLPWQIALACWIGLTPWWLFGHAIASEPRQATIYFLMLGMMLTFEKLRVQTKNASNRLCVGHGYSYGYSRSF